MRFLEINTIIGRISVFISVVYVCPQNNEKEWPITTTLRCKTDAEEKIMSIISPVSWNREATVVRSSSGLPGLLHAE